MKKNLSRLGAGLAAVAIGLALSACGGDPLESGGDGDTIVIGSADFGESEIIAEIYAQALESAGYTVERRLRIGAREAYIGALENGEIDLLPEYSGNLLLYFDPENEATAPEDVIEALGGALPAGLVVYTPAQAENKDSLNVTRELAEEHDLTSIADLAKLDGFALAANPEFAERAYGIPGLERVYGLNDIDFVPISDGGGPATVKALLDDDVQVADIYSTTPAIVDNDLVTLEDPESLIAAQQIIPLLREEIASEEVAAVLDGIAAVLTTEDLLELNGRNQGDEKAAAATVAKDWLESRGLL